MSNPFAKPGASAKPSPFGAPAPSPAQAAPAARAPQTQPAQPSAPSGRRRAPVQIGEVQSGPSASKLKGYVDERTPVEGEYLCYVSAFSFWPESTGMGITVKIHAPGTPVHGVEVKEAVTAAPFQSPDNPATPKKRQGHQRRVAEFFSASGWPMTKWDQESGSSARIPPINKFWVAEAGGLIVPVMMRGTFSLYRPEGNPLKWYQNCDKMVRTDPLLIAPVPRMVPKWLAIDFRWPGSMQVSKNGNEYYAVDVDALYNGDNPLHNRQEWGRTFSGEEHPSEVPFG